MINKTKEYKTGLFFRGLKNSCSSEKLVKSLMQFLDSKGNNDKFAISAEYVSYVPASKCSILDFDKVKTDIESGEINCVVVKDFTLVSRNACKLYEALDYFLEKNIRFISVEDKYDNLEKLRKVAK